MTDQDVNIRVRTSADTKGAKAAARSIKEIERELRDARKAFRDACRRAEDLTPKPTAEEDHAERIAALREQIADCDSEDQAVKLWRELADAQAVASVHGIRAEKAGKAWAEADKLIARALDKASEMVGEAVGNSFERVQEILNRLVSPHVHAWLGWEAFERGVLQDARANIAGSSLACGPANFLQRELGNVRRSYPGTSVRDRCRAVLSAMEQVEARVPEIAEQTARINATADAVENLLEN